MCEPAANADVAVVATPFTRVTAGTAVPSMVNTTDPVGVPPGPDTVAENVTLSPNTDGLLSDDDTTVDRRTPPSPSDPATGHPSSSE